MNKFLAFFSIITVLILTSGVAAQQINPDRDGRSNNIQIEPLQEKTFLDRISDSLSFALAFVQPEDKEVVNNEEIKVPVELEATESSYGFGEYYFYVEVYDCETDECASQTFIESVKVGDAFGTLTEGSTWTTEVSYTVPENLNGEFAVNTYIWDDIDGERASTISVSQYTVVDPTSGGGSGGDGDNIDSDGDGVLDENDECPNEYGEKDNGCPINSPDDTDGDGVTDNIDQCTYQYGEGEDGCPIDSDGDGVNDYQDQCDERPGPESNRGCPENTGGTSLNTPALFAAFAGLLLIAGGVYFRYG